MSRGSAAVALLVLLLGTGNGRAADPAPAWPQGLLEAASAHRSSLSAGQEAVRKSSLETSFGVEETVQFDLVTHACHRGPGQAWRDYGEPQFLSASGGTARVRYPFQLYFRQALTLEEMFRKPWREGSDGEIEVTFQSQGGRWAATGKKEILQRKESAPKKGAGDGKEKGAGRHD